MHKEQASKLFRVLSDEARVKIVKMLYNKGEMNEKELLEKIGCTKSELTVHLQILLNSQLIQRNEEIFFCNKHLVDELMSFLVTPCKCTK